MMSMVRMEMKMMMVRRRERMEQRNRHFLSAGSAPNTLQNHTLQIRKNQRKELGVQKHRQHQNQRHRR